MILKFVHLGHHSSASGIKRQINEPSSHQSSGRFGSLYEAVKTRSNSYRVIFPTNNSQRLPNNDMYDNLGVPSERSFNSKIMTPREFSAISNATFKDNDDSPDRPNNKKTNSNLHSFPEITIKYFKNDFLDINKMKMVADDDAHDDDTSNGNM